MNINEQVATKIFQVYNPDLVWNWEATKKQAPLTSKICEKLADQIIPIVRADCQKEIYPQIGNIINLVLFRKFSTAQTALAKLYDALKSGTFSKDTK